jgi:hypothetical protein
MGAAIPHLVFLAVSLPQILPFAADEMRTEYLTGTVEVTDEVFPEDEDEDVSYQTRGKSTLSVVLTIGDGDSEHAGGSGSVGGQGKGRRAKKAAGKVVGKEKAAARPPQVVFQEPEQDDMDIG